MTQPPRIRRLLEVEDDIEQKDYYLLELENASGKHLGKRAARRRKAVGTVEEAKSTLHGTMKGFHGSAPRS